MNRKQQVGVGKRGWIERCMSYELPDGLQNGMRALVIAIDAAAHEVTVAAEDGQPWQLDPIHFDAGWHFQISGKLYAEKRQKLAGSCDWFSACSMGSQAMGNRT